MSDQGRAGACSRWVVTCLAAVPLLQLAGCGHKSTAPAAPASSATSAAVSDPLKPLQDTLAAYRAIIVLLANEKDLSAVELEAASQVGQAIFHENVERQARIDQTTATVLAQAGQAKYATVEAQLGFIESGEGLYDADRLAFREILLDLQRRLAADPTLPAIKLHKRIADDLEAMTEIQHAYDGELKAIFNRFAPRAIELKRERWIDYVAHLNKLMPRDRVLKDYGLILPAKPSAESAHVAKARSEGREMFGQSLPPKTVLLTFDDGPHKVYSEEIAAILKQYDAPAVFFEVGRSLGTVDEVGHAQLGALAAVSRQLRADGYTIGNHSYSHAQLSKLSGSALKAEIDPTDVLLQALDAQRAPLFRFPYGARSAEGLEAIEARHLRSVMWSVDSLDWADPVPNSIVERVVSGVEHDGRGIILFHDIHGRTVEALPKILERLSADGFRFAGWDGTGFTVGKDHSPPIEKATVTTGYATSWAVVIGIDDYAQWPKLQYAVNDANAVRTELVQHFGFADDHVLLLRNREATRNGILGLFESRLSHDVRKDDRLFVFFAGHGATRKLSSGRTLGYIVPADSNPDQFAADAIPMSEIQDIAEGLVAKHILFVMDACYSGLGLTRGAVAHSGNFLNDNARRIGRQMLTAGGADQMVSDGGPNGHSVFTWAVLQGLAGKADLNGDGYITATELAAYVAPAVSGMSNQTPAFGSLPGSEGGEFILELPDQTEFLNPQTTQLGGDAIAVNGKLDASVAKSAAAAVTLTDLQGVAQRVEVPRAVAVGARKLSELANDRGLQLYREQQYDAAAEQFTEALRQRPDCAQAANNLGFVYYKQARYREAARWFENTTKIDPSRAIAYLNLGDAYAHDAQPDKAKAAYTTYLALAPTGPTAADVRRRMDAL